MNEYDELPRKAVQLPLELPLLRKLVLHSRGTLSICINRICLQILFVRFLKKTL